MIRSTPRLLALVILTMVAFASNSLLCRLALRQTSIDAASFVTIRLLSGAVVLGILAHVLKSAPGGRGNWGSAAALFAYAAGFSFAYTSLPAATGALLLFGAVQLTMISHGLWTGERMRVGQWIGLGLALGGLVVLLLPGLTAPPLPGAILMVIAGAAWGIYSLHGRNAGNPLRVTAGNFQRAAILALLLSTVNFAGASLPVAGIGYAVASGALASGVGYAIWYTVLPALPTLQAATVQLSVPVLTAVGGVLFLSESPTLRLGLASVAILGGIGLFIWTRAAAGRQTPASRPPRRT